MKITQLTGDTMDKKVILLLFSLFLWGFIWMSCSENSSGSHPVSFYEELQLALDDGIEKYEGKGVSVTIIMSDGRDSCVQIKSSA